MSQNTDTPTIGSLGVGMRFTFPPDATKSEQDLSMSIQRWHIMLRDVTLQLVTGNFLVFQSDNSADAGRPAASMSALPPTAFQSNVFHDIGPSHAPDHPISSAQPVNFQFMDRLPVFVQSTVSFMLSGLYRELDQTRKRGLHERNVMGKRYAYLVQCRSTAEKEKKVAQDLLSKAIAALQAAEKEREKCAHERMMALQDLRFVIRRRQSNVWAGPAVSKSISTTSMVSTSSSKSSLSSPRDLLLVPANHKHCLLTPPRTPINADASQRESKLAGSVKTTPLVPQIKELSEFVSEQIDEISSGEVNMNMIFQSAKGDTLQNPIGPYMRPPMSVEDMQKCIRCLLGKDKSLKTGNRARAFLGAPWSEIVSWDPEVLLQRGVCGIKAGSTGMASRLRMMTIIESALANQGNDAFTEEIWERPTHFCERCQQRYPITIRSDEIVPTLENFGSHMHLPSSTVTDKLDMDTDRRNMRVRNKKPHRKKLCGSNT